MYNDRRRRPPRPLRGLSRCATLPCAFYDRIRPGSQLAHSKTAPGAPGRSASGVRSEFQLSLASCASPRLALRDPLVSH
eukprot:404755-Prymnesium_polylepis.1